jgi:hypothetical protein
MCLLACFYVLDRSYPFRFLLPYYYYYYYYYCDVIRSLIANTAISDAEEKESNCPEESAFQSRPKQ